MITKDNLDKLYNPSQTLREYITESEKLFELHPANLNSLKDVDLELYVDLIDELWRREVSNEHKE